MLSIPLRPRRFCGSLLGMALGLAVALPCGAGVDPPDPPPEAEKKLVIHGYLSQAFAVSDGYQVLGIPSDGTFDYRTAGVGPGLRANGAPLPNPAPALCSPGAERRAARAAAAS